MDGEETTSKEVKRHQFDLDSATENVYTPPDGGHHKTVIGNMSIDNSSTPEGGSGGLAIRPSGIDAILNDSKPKAPAVNKSENKPTMSLQPPAAEEDDDEYEEYDYEDDDFDDNDQ